MGGVWAARPGWQQALIVLALTRLFDALVLGVVARFQAQSLWTGPDPGYLGMVSLWDGDWYRRIAETGYPAALPVGADGQVSQNAWAFYPLYPLLGRSVSTLLGVSWPVAASVVSLACAAGAVVLMRDLVERTCGPRLALWTVVLFCVYPAAPVLQLAYAESTAMLLLVCLLWCLGRGSYLTAVPVVLLLGVTRPVAVPAAVVVGVHLVRLVHRRWRRAGASPVPLGMDGGGPIGVAGGGPVGRGTLVRAGVLTLAAGVAIGLWPLVAAVVTGSPRAYTDTELAWRTSHSLLPFLPWLDVSRYLLGSVLGPVVLVLLLAGTAGWLASRRARVIAGDLRVWVVAYLGYLLVVFDPFTATFRLLLPLFPLGTLLAAASRSPAYRRALAVFGLLTQVVWLAWLWRFSPPADWPP